MVLHKLCQCNRFKRSSKGKSAQMPVCANCMQTAQISVIFIHNLTETGAAVLRPCPTSDEAPVL